MSKSMSPQHEAYEAALSQALEEGTIVGFAWTALRADGTSLGGHSISDDADAPYAGFVPGALTTAVALQHKSMMDKFSITGRDFPFDLDPGDDPDFREVEASQEGTT